METKDSNCRACEEKNSNALPKSQIASFASDNNMTGALTASFGTAVDGKTAGKLGSHFGGKSSNNLIKPFSLLCLSSITIKSNSSRVKSPGVLMSSSMRSNST